MSRRKSFLIVLALFLVIGLPVFFYLCKEVPALSDVEVQEYTNIASEILSNPDYVVPEGYNVKIDKASVTVKPESNQSKRGAVKCRVEDGTLVTKYYKQTDDVIIASLIVTASICIGIFTICIILGDIVFAICKIINKKHPPAWLEDFLL